MRAPRTRLPRYSAGLLLAAGALLLFGPPLAAATTSTWTNTAGDGEYATPGNWNPAGVPLDDGTKYYVVIPSGFSVSYDFPVPTVGTVTTLTLGSSSTLTIDPGESLTVVGDAKISGNLQATAGTFTATSAGCQFPGTAATLAATNGGQITFAAPAYSSTGLATGGATYNLLRADGIGSTLTLSAMTSMDMSFNDGWGGVTLQRISAANGGVINLSGVQTLKGAARAEDRVEFVIDSSGSNIDLSGLKTITAGSTRFDLSVPNFTLTKLESAVGTTFEVKAGTTLSLPAMVTQNGNAVTVRSSGAVSAPELLTANGVTLTVETGGTFSAPKLTTFTGGVFARAPGQVLTLVPWTNIDNSLLSTSGGELITLAAPSYTTTALSQGGVDRTLLSADGASGGGTPSQIAASAMLTLNDGFNDGWSGTTVHSIAATNGGRINLSGVQTVTGPVRAEDRLEFVIDSSGSNIDLSGLKSTAGHVKFDLSAPAYTLPLLNAAAGTTFEVKAGTTLSLPALVTQNGDAVTVRSSGAVSAPELLTATGVTLTVETGGTFSAPKLKTFTSGVFARNAGQILTLVPWTNIDNSMLSTSGGELITLAAPSYTTTALSQGGVPRTLLSANGTSGASTPSQIAATAMLTLNDGFDDGWSGTTVHSIAATNGGRINLSGVQTVTGPVRAEDRLEFVIDVAPGSNIDLSGLKSTAGHTKFDISTPAYTLPLLSAAAGTTFEARSGSALGLPVLASLAGDGVVVRAGASISAPELLTATGVTFTVETGGTFSAPKLTTFTGGVFARNAGQIFTLVPWTSIDNSILSTSGGELLSLAAPGYSAVGLGQANVLRTLLSADGTSVGGTPSRISAPAMLTLNDGFDDGWSGLTVHRINATNGGQIDFSGVETIRGPVRADDRLEFNINTGGQVDLSSLRTTTTGGQIQFNVASGGTLLLGSPTITDGARLTVDATTSLVRVAGDLTLSPTSRVAVTGAATVEVGGDFSFLYTDETAMNLDGAIFHVVGSGMEYLEVGSEDTGLPTGPASANFGLGQLVVGADGAPTVVQLLEVVDNGNRTGGAPEALYLYGLGGPDGLRILGGSTFIIDNLNVYATENNGWVHINDFFGLGQTKIPYDQGFIELPEPATLAMLALGGLALLSRRRMRLVRG